MRICLLMLAALLAAPASAQDADAVRGGWMADVGGVRHIYMFTIRGATVTGTYCTDCSSVADLAFIRNGVLGADGLRFDVHNPGPVAYTESVTARLVDGELHVTRQPRSTTGGSVTMTMRRSTSTPPPAPPPPAEGQPPRMPANYIPPGPAELLTPDKIAGLWLRGEGPAKQYFMFKQVGTELLGLACGPCDDPNFFGPLDRISIDGITLRFRLAHENNAPDWHPEPWANEVRANIAKNEMHMWVVPTYEPADFVPYEITMLGPVTQ